MFYFFHRDQAFVRCELNKADDGYELVIVREDGHESKERFDTEEALAARWAALQQHYVRDGWWGPHGRE